jgi:hypothetical protein
VNIRAQVDLCVDASVLLNLVLQVGAAPVIARGACGTR